MIGPVFRRRADTSRTVDAMARQCFRCLAFGFALHLEMRVIPQLVGVGEVVRHVDPLSKFERETVLFDRLMLFARYSDKFDFHVGSLCVARKEIDYDRHGASSRCAGCDDSYVDGIVGGEYERDISDRLAQHLSGNT